MTNNDILRRLRYTFNFNDKKMVSIFHQAGLTTTVDAVVSWLKKDDQPGFIECSDLQLAYFLNGLIIERRGVLDSRPQIAEKRLNNNIILIKLKIALSLKSDDIVALMQETHLKIGKSELGAFLRKPDHRNFKKCHDQFLRNFILGIDKKFNVKQTTDTQSKSHRGSYQKNKRPLKIYKNPIRKDPTNSLDTLKKAPTKLTRTRAAMDDSDETNKTNSEKVSTQPTSQHRKNSSASSKSANKKNTRDKNNEINETNIHPKTEQNHDIYKKSKIKFSKEKDKGKGSFLVDDPKS